MKRTINIPGISCDDMQRLVSVFNVEESISEVILYGSRAKGTYQPGSDIDLTLKGDGLTTRWLEGLTSRIDDLLLPYEVDISILTQIENIDLRDHIVRVGKVVFRNG